MASMPPSLGVVTRSSPDGKGHSVSERSLPLETNEAHGRRYAFKSKSKYLRYLPAGDQIQKKSNLAMTGEDVKNPYSRFCLEPSRKHRNEGLVHIKCSYNNKYWVPDVEPGPGMYSLIFCREDEPQDDKSKPKCTLFRPRYHTGSTISFLYMGTTSVCLGNNDRDGYLILGIESVDPTQFMAIDLEKHGMVLPEQVCFRGNNGKYLRVVDDVGLQFSANDIADPRAQQTIVTNENGTIRIKSTYRNKFWRFDEPDKELGGVYAAVDPQGKMTDDTILHLVKLDNNEVALQVTGKKGNKLYCQRVDYGKSKGNLLRTATQFIVKEVKLQMHEAVLSRRIYNVEYHTLDVRVYGTKTLTMTAAQAINRSSKENKAKLTLTYSSAKQATWEVGFECFNHGRCLSHHEG